MRRAVLLLLLAACEKDTEVDRDYGGRCTVPEDCTHVCLSAPSYPGGFCSRDCARDDDCPLASACVPAEGGAACLFSCFDDRDCSFLDSEIASGWECRELMVPDAGTRLVCRGP